MAQKEDSLAKRALDNYLDHARYMSVGIGLGVATGLLGRYLAIQFKMGLVTRIVFQLILLVTVSTILKLATSNFNSDEPHGTGNFHTFYYGVQVFLFLDIATLFGLQIKDKDCRR